MSEPLIFDREYFARGESAFTRGVPLAEIIDTMNLKHKDANSYEKREQRGLGYILGYVNGALQAIRRLDQAINIPRD